MKQLLIFISLILTSSFQVAIACSPVDGWRLPTVEEAYRKAIIVIHAKVISQKQIDHVTKGQIKIINTYKGNFPDHEVTTGDSGACGIGPFTIGKEYVFFFYTEEATFNNSKWYVTFLGQPSTYEIEHVVDEIRRIKSTSTNQ